MSVFSRDDLDVELYEPSVIDLQSAHERDEIYIIARGSGTLLINEGAKVNFTPGDMLFVSARVEHRFTEFSSDFATWVLFFGKERDP